MMDRCDCCGGQVGPDGIWIVVDTRQYRFCSNNCLNNYDPTTYKEIVI